MLALALKTRKIFGALSVCGALLCSLAVQAGPSEKTQTIWDSPLAGSWITPCISATSYSARNEVKFSPETMRWRGTSYTSTNCMDQDFSFEMHNKYEVGLNSGEHFELDYTLQKIMFLFSTQRAVTQANDYVYCGIKDWQVNVSRDVTGKDCGGTIYKAGDVTYDLVRLDSGMRVYFGYFEDGRDGKSPEARPIAIDPHQAYLKAFGKFPIHP